LGMCPPLNCFLNWRFFFLAKYFREWVAESMRALLSQRRVGARSIRATEPTGAAVVGDAANVTRCGA
jgi:hypothetical protein